MTAAARPTFEPAVGRRGKGESDLSQLSKQYSNEDEDFDKESDDDDDDDTVALAELEKINKERAEEQARKEQKQK
eukprot:bmy_21952T0